MPDTSGTNVIRVGHEYETSEKRATRVRHDSYTSDTRMTRVENFDFDNDTGRNIFSHPYIYYMASEGLQADEQFHSKNIFWKCLVSMPKCV